MSNDKTKGILNFSSKELLILQENYEILYTLLEQLLNLYSANDELGIKALEYLNPKDLPYPEFVTDFKKAYKRIGELRNEIPHIKDI